MNIVERYQDQIRGVIGCFDRIIIQGTLPYLCYADGMTSWLRKHDVRIFDYPRYTEPLRDEIRANAERLAHAHGVEIEFVSSSKVRKTIYSLSDLRWLLAAANRRYIDFIGELRDPSVGINNLRKVSEPTDSNGRRYKGFNFFGACDILIFESIAAGQHNVSGFRNRDIRRGLSDLSAGQVSRILKRLRLHGLIKRVGRTYKYYLTRLGRQVILTGLKLPELVVIPELALPSR